MLWRVNTWATMWGEGTKLLEAKQIPKKKAAYSPPWKTSSASVPTLVIKRSEANARDQNRI